MAFEKNPDELGALWVKSNARGEFMTGKIEGVGDVVVFPVTKGGPNSPRWRVLKSKPREDAKPAQPVAADDIQF